MSLQGEPQHIDRDYVRLLMVMRRFVRDEFDVKVAISELDAVEKLLHYAELSRNEVFQEMGKELRSMLVPEAPAQEQAETQQKVHYYRGVAQPVAINKAPEVGLAQQNGPAKRVYRGQVVSG